MTFEQLDKVCRRKAYKKATLAAHNAQGTSQKAKAIVEMNRVALEILKQIEENGK